MDLRQITQALVYDENDELRGAVEKMEIGDVGSSEVEHKALGMVGVLNLPGRPVEAVTAKLTLKSMDEELERRLLNPAARHNWQLHQRVDVFDQGGFSPTKSHVIVHQVGFHTMKRPSFSSELGENGMPEYELSVPYLRQFRQGEQQDILLLDIFNDTYQINGQDVWPR